MLLTAALLTAALAQVNPAPPAVTTGAAEGVTTSAATVNGTVNPNGASTAYHVEYGVSSNYGLTTADQDAGAGTDPVAVTAALSKLTSNTTYHYRLVATNAAGIVRGNDRTLKTAIVPRRPTASTRPAKGVTPQTATLVTVVTPHGLPTSVHFIYGPTTSYGSTTPEVPVGSGASGVTISIPIGGLTPHTRYHFRAVATNSAGTSRGGDRYLTTRRAPTGVTIVPSTSHVRWGSGTQITGAVTGIGSVPVALERDEFPYGDGYAEMAAVNAAGNGSFTFNVPALYTATRLRVVTRTSIVAESAPSTIHVAVKVGIKAKRHGRRHVRLSGTLWPAVPRGRLSLQRRSRSGHWHTLRHAKPKPKSGDRSQYRFTVRRAKHRQSYRVIVLAHDGGAHSPGASKVVRIARNRR
jgi:hypothetical protein